MLNEVHKNRYRNALKGLKAQASAVTKAIPGNPDKNELASAHTLMSEHDTECKVIYKMVMKHSVPVPELDENLLFEWLT
ncbi:hypothetical protein M6C35_001925 [Vibrio metschnikovii]|nr:hypothetical protein [Vibrio metschnikovii]